MKLLNKKLLPNIVFLTIATTTVANADTNRLIFPPVNPLNNAPSNMGSAYRFPPQVPSRPMLNRAPQTAYNFNRTAPQQFNAPANMRNPRMPAYGQRPQQAAPRMMPNTRPRQANPQQRYNKSYPKYPYARNNNNTNSSFPFSNNMMPFGNSANNNFMPFSNGNMPFNSNSFGMPNNPMNNMFGNNKGSNMPFFKQSNNKRKKAWGNDRNIWPDFYTDFTDEAWDTVMGGPRDLGTMPGGWRFPYISTPDPVTVSDAIVNQFPPIAEEAGNMADFSDWGVFDNK